MRELHLMNFFLEKDIQRIVSTIDYSYNSTLH